MGKTIMRIITIPLEVILVLTIISVTAVTIVIGYLAYEQGIEIEVPSIELEMPSVQLPDSDEIVYTLADIYNSITNGSSEAAVALVLGIVIFINTVFLFFAFRYWIDRSDYGLYDVPMD